MTLSPTCFGDGAGLAGDHRLVHVGGSRDDQAIGRDPRTGSDEHDIVHLQCADRHFLGAIGRHPLGGVRQQSREGRERALCLRDRPHLEPVPEQHDRDQGGQFPPDLDLEEAERASPRGHEGDDDRQRDEGHHPGLAVGQLALGSTDEDQPAVEEDDRAEDRRHVLDARDRPGSCSRASSCDSGLSRMTGIVRARLSQNLSRNMATEWPACRSWPAACSPCCAATSVLVRDALGGLRGPCWSVLRYSPPVSPTSQDGEACGSPPVTESRVALPSVSPRRRRRSLG